MSTSAATAMVVTVALALTVVSPVDVAVTVARVGGGVRGVTGDGDADADVGARAASDVDDEMGEVHVESRMVAANAPEAADSV